MSGYLQYSHPESQHVLANDSSYGYLRTGRHAGQSQRRQPSSKQLLSTSAVYGEVGHNHRQHKPSGQNGALSLPRPPGYHNRSGRESPNHNFDDMAIDIPKLPSSKLGHGPNKFSRGLGNFNAGVRDAAANANGNLVCKHRRNGPLIKLTQGLLKTYKAINKKYYDEKQQKKKSRAREARRPPATVSNRTNPLLARQQSGVHAPPRQQQNRQRNNHPAEPGPTNSTPRANHSHRAPAPARAGPGPSSNPPAQGWTAGHGQHQQRVPQVAGHSHQQKYQPKLSAVNDAGRAVDTPDHDYIIHPGQVLNEKWRLDKQIGKGCFGVVVKATDVRSNAPVAIKIIKAKRAFFEQAQTEIGILSHLNYNDANDTQKIVRLFEVFIHKNHRCLVFELLSHSLYKLLKDTNFKGVSLTLVRKFTYQLLVALKFMRVKHPKGIIHADLKPENILLVSPERSQIKVIDFGSSCFENRKMYSYIQSRFYRAPEILLGKVYSYPIDMWSLGCILLELHTGEPIFPGLSEEDQLCKIVTVLGMPPKLLTHRAKKWDKFFINTNIGMQLRRPPPKKKKRANKDYGLNQTPILPLSELKTRTFEEAVTNARRRRRNESRDHSAKDYEQFLNMVKRMLVWEPNRRITPDEALQHAWLQPVLLKNQGQHAYGSSAQNWPSPSRRQPPGGSGYMPSSNPIRNW